MNANPHFEKARAALAAWAKDSQREPAVADVFECHIFCEPLNPDAETKQRFVEACAAAQVKPLCLGLDFEGQGVIDVLQTSRYYKADNSSQPVAAMLRDAEALAESFKVVRLKLEAMAVSAGVPRADDEMARMNALTGFDHYFEYHVKFGGEVSRENDEALKALARALTQELGVKVPFSCNSLGEKRQRFLNARTYGLGFDASRQVAQRVAREAEARGFRATKCIEEFIVFDTNKELDRGWLEFGR